MYGKILNNLYVCFYSIERQMEILDGENCYRYNIMMQK